MMTLLCHSNILYILQNVAHSPALVKSLCFISWLLWLSDKPSAFEWSEAWRAPACPASACFTIAA